MSKCFDKHQSVYKKEPTEPGSGSGYNHGDRTHRSDSSNRGAYYATYAETAWNAGGSYHPAYKCPRCLICTNLYKIYYFLVNGKQSDDQDNVVDLVHWLHGHQSHRYMIKNPIDPSEQKTDWLWNFKCSKHYKLLKLKLKLINQIDMLTRLYHSNNGGGNGGGKECASCAVHDTKDTHDLLVRLEDYKNDLKPTLERLFDRYMQSRLKNSFEINTLTDLNCFVRQVDVIGSMAGSSSAEYDSIEYCANRIHYLLDALVYDNLKFDEFSKYGPKTASGTASRGTYGRSNRSSYANSVHQYSSQTSGGSRLSPRRNSYVGKDEANAYDYNNNTSRYSAPRSLNETSNLRSKYNGNSEFSVKKNEPDYYEPPVVVHDLPAVDTTVRLSSTVTTPAVATVADNHQNSSADANYDYEPSEEVMCPPAEVAVRKSKKRARQDSKSKSSSLSSKKSRPAEPKVSLSSSSTSTSCILSSSSTSTTSISISTSLSSSSICSSTSSCSSASSTCSSSSSSSSSCSNTSLAGSSPSASSTSTCSSARKKQRTKKISSSSKRKSKKASKQSLKAKKAKTVRKNRPKPVVSNEPVNDLPANSSSLMTEIKKNNNNNNNSNNSTNSKPAETATQPPLVVLVDFKLDQNCKHCDSELDELCELMPLLSYKLTNLNVFEYLNDATNKLNLLDRYESILADMYDTLNNNNNNDEDKQRQLLLKDELVVDFNSKLDLMKLVTAECYQRLDSTCQFLTKLKDIFVDLMADKNNELVVEQCRKDIVNWQSDLLHYAQSLKATCSSTSIVKSLSIYCLFDLLDRFVTIYAVE